MRFPWIVFCLATLVSGSIWAETFNQHPLWPLKKDHWEESDENNYANWIPINATSEVFKDSGMQFDCAEAAIALRWIFAFENGLPAAQTLANTHELFGSWESTEDWDKLPTDASWKKNEKFKAGLHFVLSHTYTHSLINDLYPVQINRDYVRGGTIYLLLREISGHTTTITKITSDPPCFGPCLLTVWGDEPASDKVFFSQAPLEVLKKNQGGFMRFRWPELIHGHWRLRPITQMPGFSDEQYSWDQLNYFTNIEVNLKLWRNPQEEVSTFSNAILNTWRDRWQLTEQGYYICGLQACPKGSDNEVYFSTPVRDQSLKDQSLALEGFLKANSQNESVQQIAQTSLDIDLSKAGFNLNPWNLIGDIATTLRGWKNSANFDIFSRWGWTDNRTLKELTLLGQVLYDNWVWRDQLVFDALLICYRDNLFQCATMTPELKDQLEGLDTSTFDQGFRLAKKEILSRLAVLNGVDQGSFGSWTQNQVLSETCGPRNCNLSDLLLMPSAIDSMTGLPTDPDTLRRPLLPVAP